MLAYCRAYRCFSNSKILPVELLNETLLSLCLLYPTWELPTTKYLQRKAPGFFPPAPDRILPQIYLSDFCYWHDRIAVLLTETRSPPKTLKLVWKDDRNPLQWWTFWLAAAILVWTLVFGLITTIATCMQTKYAYQSLQLARAAAKFPRHSATHGVHHTALVRSVD